MKDLSTPSRDLALSVEREVEFRERLTAGSLNPRSGIRALDIYSLEEAFNLLGEPLPQINLAELESWVRTTIGDAELAERIKQSAAQPGILRERLRGIRDLLGLRLIQCRQAADQPA